MTAVGTVALQVADLERSLRFYQGVLGFRVLSRADTPGARRADLGAHGSGRVLVELHEKPGVRPIPRRGRLGIYHFAILLPTRPDLGRFLRQASALGVHIGASDHGVSEALYLLDPDGITVEVYRDRRREEWPRHDGELVALSDPLDSPALLAVAGDPPWEGLPGGTTIGHVHFYVDDLAAAEAFYHGGLGFDVMIRSFPGALFVAADGYHHHVGLNTWAAGSPAASEDDAKLLFWELVLPDAAAVGATAERLRVNGYDAAREDGYWSAADPWGITVRLVGGPPQR